MVRELSSLDGDEIDREWDLALADYDGWAGDVRPLTERLHAIRPGLPLILLTDRIGPEQRLQAVRDGAYDVLSPAALAEQLPVLLARQACCTRRDSAAGMDYQRVFRELDDAVLVADAATGILIDANRQAEVLLGRTRDQILRLHQSQLHPPHKVEKHRARFQRLAATGILEPDRDSEIVHKQGHTVPVSISGTLIDDGTRRLIVGVFRDISQRRRMEQALRENQRMLATLMSNLPGMAFRCRNDRDWTMEFVSDGCLQLTGYAPADLVDNRRIAYARIIHPEDRDTVCRMIQAALAQKQPYQASYRIITRHGERKWIWEQGCGVFGPDGRSAAIEGLIVDITEQKDVQEALEQSRRFASRVIETTPNLIYIYDLQARRTVYVTPALHRVLGYTAQDLSRIENESPMQIYHPDDRADLERCARALEAAGDGQILEHEYRMRHAEGHYVLLHSREVVFLRDDDGCPRQIIGTAVDITERHRAQQALLESEERFRRLAENAQDVIYRIRTVPEPRFEYVSPAVSTVLGYAADEAQAAGFLERTTHPDDLPQVLEYIAGRMDLDNPFMVRVQRKDRKWVVLEVRCTAIRDENGQIVAMDGIARDVSERLRAQEALLERASLRELSHRIIQGQEQERRRLSRELHDEAGQALTAIKLNSELLAKKMPEDRPDLRRLAADTAEVSVSLISEMRRIAAALRPTVLEDLGLLAALRWYTKGIEMRYNVPIKLISRGLDGRLEESFEVTVYRIVQEALTNVVRHARASHAVVRVTRTGRKLNLCVSDDGCGMDPAVNRAGTGLTGIRERAHLYHGQMWLEGRVGEGTSLHVRFPNIPETGPCATT